MCAFSDLASMVFSGLSALVIEDVADEEDLIRVRARTRGGPVGCPGCGSSSAWVHAFCERVLTDVPVDARPVVLVVRVRRLVCGNFGCPRRTFREQVPGVLQRYQRRTPRLAACIGVVVRELAGRAGRRILSALDVEISRHTALRILLNLPLGPPRVPRVLGVDDFALRRRHRYAPILIDAETRERIDVLPDRKADTLEAWLRSHPGVEVVCRDSSGAYAEAVRRVLPDALQVADRWHIWHNLSEAVLKEVAAHSGCWAKAGPPRQILDREETTLDRWRKVHELLDRGVGLLECARRLQLGLNTVKRYARASEPNRLRRAPQYRPTLVDPYREYLRRRRAEDPAAGASQLFGEIRTLGYPGSLNLLYRYITQGRVEADRLPISPRRLSGILLTGPGKLRDEQSELLERIISSCPEMTALAGRIRSFARLLTPGENNSGNLDKWITAVHTDDLPCLRTFTRGLNQDLDAVRAGLTYPWPSGRTEGVNTKTKLIKRHMYGRSGFPLLHHRILLA